MAAWPRAVRFERDCNRHGINTAWGGAGIPQRILADALDESAKRGHRTRLVRFAPGAKTNEPFVHDYWEEVLVVSGTLIDSDGPVARPALAIWPLTELSVMIRP